MLTEARQIEDFLNEYKRSRVISESGVRAALNRALEYEQKFQKPFYTFTIDEVLEMYKSVNAISIRSLQNTNLTLKHASRWILDNKQINIYDSITKELLQDCIDIKKKESLILSRQDLNNIQNELLNNTDKGILEMLFLGAGGHWLKELTFFDMSQVSRKDKLIYFHTGKTIPITEEDYELIKAACEEDELISFGETMRVSKVKSHGLFKQRFNSLSPNDNPSDEGDMERRFRFIQRRLSLISKESGVQLISSGIQTGGLLHHLKLGVAETELSFREYVKTNEARQIAKRYDLYTELYSQILIERFETYFL